MSRYLIDKCKSKYRVKSHYDLNTNDFIRNDDGNFEDGNLYIDCQNGIEISHYGDKILKAYIPSIGRGRNIIRKLEEDGMKDVVMDYLETDEEVVFMFNIKFLDTIAKLCGAKTKGADISPFSVKNLPSDKPSWNKYEPQNKDTYDKMLELLKLWINKKGMNIGKAYEKYYSDFGKHVKVDFVAMSKEQNYKVLHVIDREGYTEKAIEWLGQF